MSKRCRHRKGVILAYANYVDFVPDQEPFKEGIIESCGLESIKVESTSVHYCPKCNVIQSLEVDGEIVPTEI